MHFLAHTLTLALAATAVYSQDSSTVIAVPPTNATSSAASAATSGGTLSGANLVLMPLGDSITYGFGSSDGNGYRGALYDDLVGAGATVDMVGSLQSGSMSDPDSEIGPHPCLSFSFSGWAG